MTSPVTAATPQPSAASRRRRSLFVDPGFRTRRKYILFTTRYATIKDQTLRREWERYQDRINVLGEVVHLDPDGPLADAAWAKENLARAEQTLPNGYCGLPLQQTCPHPNACLTCPSFLTTIEFFPQHREQLDRTDQLIAQAEADGRQRLVEMNTPIRLNLLRIIDGLATLDTEASDGD